MPFDKDPNELGSIFISHGKGNYADTTFFGGKSFPIQDGVYRLENVSGTSKKTGNPYHLIRVLRVEQAEEPIDVHAEIERFRSSVVSDEVPF